MEEETHSFKSQDLSQSFSSATSIDSNNSPSFPPSFQPFTPHIPTVVELGQNVENSTIKIRTPSTPNAFIPYTSCIEWSLKEKNAPPLSQTKPRSSSRIKSACADLNAPKKLEEKTRKGEWIKQKNSYLISKAHTLEKVYVDGNFLQKCIQWNGKFLKKEEEVIQKKIRPILKIHKKLQELERGRQPGEKFLDYCMVRMNKGFDVEPARLLAFHDTKPPENYTYPWEWKEQTVTIQLMTTNTTCRVEMRRVKAIGEKYCGKGARKRQKTDILSPTVKLSKSKSKHYKPTSKFDSGLWPLPYVKPVRERQYGNAPVTNDSDQSSESDDDSSV